MARFWFGRTFGNNSGSVGPPAGATLAVADNGNGTGGVATITAADSGATVTVYSLAVDGALGTNSWVSRGSRSGNGTVAMTITTAGYYWFRAESSTAGGISQSNLVYQNISSGTTSVHYRCLTGAQSRIQGLALAGIANASVIVRKVPVDRYLAPADVPLPAVVISPAGGETMDPQAGVNARDDIGYPVSGLIVAADNQAVAASEAHLKWREKIARAFRSQRLPGVSEIISTAIEPYDIVSPEAWGRANLIVSGMTVRFISREVRGVT